MAKLYMIEKSYERNGKAVPVNVKFYTNSLNAAIELVNSKIEEAIHYLRYAHEIHRENDLVSNKDGVKLEKAIYKVRFADGTNWQNERYYIPFLNDDDLKEYYTITEVNVNM